jgi:biopolymer transport protein ExbD
MSKLKSAPKSPHIDMTPMVDMFAVLLTFFILTATVKPPETAQVDVPFSVSEKTVPTFNLMTVVLSDDGRVFFNVDNGPDTLLQYRARILEQMGDRYGIEFTEAELNQFAKMNAEFGLSIFGMKDFLAARDQRERDAIQTGIPIDSTDNQLADWILIARRVNPNVAATIKGDADVEFPRVKEVLDVLQDRNVNRFNLITSLRVVEVTTEPEE